MLKPASWLSSSEKLHFFLWVCKNEEGKQTIFSFALYFLIFFCFWEKKKSMCLLCRILCNDWSFRERGFIDVPFRVYCVQRKNVLSPFLAPQDYFCAQTTNRPKKNSVWSNQSYSFHMYTFLVDLRRFCGGSAYVFSRVVRLCRLLRRLCCHRSLVRGRSHDFGQVESCIACPWLLGERFGRRASWRR